MDRSESYTLRDKNKLELEKERLKEQAETLFGCDLEVLNKIIPNYSNVVDLGTGNGVYLNCLSDYFRLESYTGVDRNTDLLKSCIEFNVNKNIDYIESDIIDLNYLRSKISTENTLFTLRFVLQHMNNVEISKFLKSFKINFPESTLLIIDIHSDSISVEPIEDSIIEINKKTNIFQARRGGNRNIVKTLPKYLVDNGYQVINIYENNLDSSKLGKENFAKVFFPIWDCLKGTDLYDEEEFKIKTSWEREFKTNKMFKMSYTFEYIHAKPI